MDPTASSNSTPRASSSALTSWPSMTDCVQALPVNTWSESKLCERRTPQPIGVAITAIVRAPAGSRRRLRECEKPYGGASGAHASCALAAAQSSPCREGFRVSPHTSVSATSSYVRANIAILNARCYSVVNDVAGRAVVLRVLCDRPRRPEGDLLPGSVWVPSDRASLAAGVVHKLRARIATLPPPRTSSAPRTNPAPGASTAIRT